MAPNPEPAITLTGADEQTSLDGLLRLSDLGAEIGILYSFAPDGRHRYPPLPWITDAVAALKGRAAVHICGSRARAELLRGGLDQLLAPVKRFQVNGQVMPTELRTICERFPSHTVITQHTFCNARLLGVAVPNHAVLVDASGGRGLLPKDWVRPETDKPVGFAGGLGPSTIWNALPKIARAARGSWWIDAESRLRDADDWFSVELALQMMSIWSDWKSLDGRDASEP